MAKLKAWERQEYDTDKSFAAFTQYISMPPRERSIEAVLRNSGKSAGNQRYYEEWSRKHNWVARAAAWDDYNAELQRAAAIEDRLKQRKARRRLTEGMIIAIQNQLFVEDGHGGVKVKKLDMEDLDKLSRSLARVLDQSRQEYDDMPTQRSEIAGKDGGPITIVQTGMNLDDL